MTPVLAWPIVGFLGLLIYRRVLIGYQDPISLGLISDLLLIAIMFFLSIKRESRFIKVSSSLLALYILLYYWLDTCVMVAVSYRLTWDLFLANYKYINAAEYFISPKLVIFTLFIFLFPLALCRKVFALPFKTSSTTFLSYQAMFIFTAADLATDHILYTKEEGRALMLDKHPSSFTKSIKEETLATVHQKYSSVSEKATHFLQGDPWKTLPNKSVNQPNILIILSESLSGVDSNYAGGLFDRLPNIDKIQEDGIAFKHASSNGKITVHGLASLLLGLQPIKTGGYKIAAEQFPPEKFSTNNLIAYAQKAGYQPIIISAGQPRHWFELTNWFKTIGFRTVYDEQSDEFKNAPRFTWNAPSDEAMYALAKKLIPQEKKPFLLVIETVSLHQPYILPDEKYHISNSGLLNQIHYVDETTYAFYQYLKEKTTFFNNGLFVLVGDHRRFEPLESKELENGGYADWHERIVATIVGHHVTPKATFDKPFSLIDMNILLHHILGGYTVVDNKFISNSNLSTLLGYHEPFSVTLADESNGSYLVRSAPYPPMYFSVFGDIDFNKIPYDLYKGAAVYLINNHQYVTETLTK